MPATEAVHGAWEDLCVQLRTIGSVYLYLNRTFLITKPDIRSLWFLGLALFRVALETHGDGVVLQRVVAALAVGLRYFFSSPSLFVFW